jgi:hypothetical protein
MAGITINQLPSASGLLPSDILLASSGSVTSQVTLSDLKNSIFQTTGSIAISGSLNISGSLTASLQEGYVWVGAANGKTATVSTSSFAGGSGSISTSGTTLYSTNPATSGFSTNNSIFIGNETGKNANMSYFANFIGYQSGKGATNAAYSTFIGIEAGVSASSAMSSVFLGYRAGYSAKDAAGSNFIGDNAGFNATSASFSNLFGYNIANGSDIGRNNIIIGTNITLDNQRQDSINIGGILFGTGSYFNDGGFPYAGSMPNGKIGINQPLPTSTFEVSGSRAGRVTVYTNAGAYTLGNEEFAIFQPGLNVISAVLPNPTTCVGRVYHIINSGTDILTISEYQINGGSSATTVGVKKSIMLVSVGLYWFSMSP